MSDLHLTPEQLQAWREHTLSGAALRQVDAHLATCPDCRLQLTTGRSAGTLQAGWEAALAAEPEGVKTHPEYEELLAYLEGRQGEVDREITESHLEWCSSCALELEELRAYFAGEFSLPTEAADAAGLSAATSAPAGTGDPAGDPGYAAYSRRRERLASVLATLSGAYRQLGLEERAEKLLQHQARLLDDTFKVLVAGEFKRGKSTLVNALLGESVLPARIAPCTAVITHVRYGERKEAVLHHKDGRAPLVLSLEHSAEALREHLTIPADEPETEDAAAAVSRSPYSRVEVRYPLALLRGGVEIVDSPGLNEQQTRTEITREFFAEADALVVVLACDQAFADTERQFVESDLQGSNLRDVFFVWNRYDTIRSLPQDDEHVRRISRNRLESRAGSGVRVFFVSSSEALQARKHGDAALLAVSGFPQLEAALERFLAVDRGRVKLERPLLAAEAALREALEELIPLRQSLLTRPVAEVRAVLEQQQPRLEAVEGQGAELLRRVEGRGREASRDAVSSYRRLATELEAGLRERGRALQPSVWQTLASRSQSRTRAAAELDEWLYDRLRQWERESLAPLVATHLQELEGDLNRQAGELQQNLRYLKGELVSRPRALPDTSLNPFFGTALAAFAAPAYSAGGAFLGQSGAAVRALAPTAALGVGLAMAGLTLPVALPALAVFGAWRALRGARQDAEEVRDAAVEQVAASLKSQHSATERNIEARLEQLFQAIRRSVREHLAEQIDPVGTRARALLEARADGELTAAAGLASLEQVRASLAVQAEILESLQNRFENG